MEGWTSFFLLLASFVGCMENIWNIVAGKLPLAVCDQHSVAGVSAKPSLDSDCCSVPNVCCLSVGIPIVGNLLSLREDQHK